MEPTRQQEWLPCIQRQMVVLCHKDGSKGELHRCIHQSSKHFAQELTPENCAACPLRVFTRMRPPDYSALQVNGREFGEPKIMEDGSLVYPKLGWEPPRAPEGYTRKSDDPKSADAWVFLPQWPPCVDREMANTVLPCGCIKVNPICASLACERHGRRVTVEMCRECPVRRPPLEKVNVQESPVQLCLGQAVGECVVRPVVGDAEPSAEGA